MQLAKVSIDPKFIELSADVLRDLFLFYNQRKYCHTAVISSRFLGCPTTSSRKRLTYTLKRISNCKTHNDVEHPYLTLTLTQSNPINEFKDTPLRLVRCCCLCFTLISAPKLLCRIPGM